MGKKYNRKGKMSQRCCLTRKDISYKLSPSVTSCLCDYNLIWWLHITNNSSSAASLASFLLCIKAEYATVRRRQCGSSRSQTNKQTNNPISNRPPVSCQVWWVTWATSQSAKRICVSIACIISHHWDKAVGSLQLYDTVRLIKLLFLTEGPSVCVCVRESSCPSVR